MKTKGSQMLNTKEARKLVRNLIAQKQGTYCYYSATNKKVTAGADDATKRNLCFGIGGDMFTESECNRIKELVGCKRVHTTFYEGKEYLRLIGVKFEK